MRDRIIQPDKLRDLMGRREFTARDLAERSGVSLSHIKYVIGGQFQLSDRSAADVAAALGVKVTAFSRAKTTAEKTAETERRRAAARRSSHHGSAA